MMAAPTGIAIPALKPDERIEDWQPLFVAATSSLAAHAGERAAVLISFLRLQEGIRKRHGPGRNTGRNYRGRFQGPL